MSSSGLRRKAQDIRHASTRSYALFETRQSNHALLLSTADPVGSESGAPAGGTGKVCERARFAFHLSRCSRTLFVRRHQSSLGKLPRMTLHWGKFSRTR